MRLWKRLRDELLRLDIRGKIYIGGSLARSLLGLDGFNRDSDIDMYIFSDSPVVVEGVVMGHRIACQYIPYEYHDLLIRGSRPRERCYLVVDLNLNPFYILDLSYLFSVVVDDARDC